jgi:hypothetical protein
VEQAFEACRRQINWRASAPEVRVNIRASSDAISA